MVLSSGSKFRIDTERLVRVSFLGVTGKTRRPLGRHPDMAR
jgi:hypothetical protein